MRFCCLGSGSEGNGLVVESASTRLLVDCGFGLQDTISYSAIDPAWLAFQVCEALDDNGRVQKTPEQWLEEAAPEKKEGVYKLFLGYAPGVGKTYNMLSEAVRRHSRGEDIVGSIKIRFARTEVNKINSGLAQVYCSLHGLQCR